MANAAALYDNFADDGTVAASSNTVGLPASNLLTPHVSERWRSATNSDFFVLDLGALQSADTVMVRGLTAGDNATVRLRLSSGDASGAAGDVFDLGIVANQANANFDLDYGAYVQLLDAPAAFRYVRFDISDPDASYVEAGAVCVGARTQFTYNFVPGASLGYVDRSRSATTSAGLTLIWVDNSYRQLGLNFDFVTSDQRYGLIEAMDRLNGQRANLLMVVDTESANLARDFIWGLIATLSAVTTPDVIDIFGKQFTINERL